MALYECRMYSKTLGTAISYFVTLPFVHNTECFTKSLDEIYGQKKKYPVVYLLHGALDDASCWIRNTNVERYAEEAGVALVIPSAQNSFYTDMVHGRPYFTFITEELPYMVKAAFPLSDKHEETYIAGLSMGGYGAMKAALSRPDIYSAVGCMSGTVIVQNVLGPDRSFMSCEDVFGDYSKITGSKHDLVALLHQRANEGNAPRIFHCCGTEDMIYADNIRLRDIAQNCDGLDYTYQEGPGTHDYNFWDTYIQKILHWMVKK